MTECAYCYDTHLMTGAMIGKGRVIGVKHEGLKATRVMVRFGDPHRPTKIIGRSPFVKAAG